MKYKLDISKSWIPSYRMGFGIIMYVLFHPDFPGPLGFVWGTGYGGKRQRFEVFGSHTYHSFVRMGVRTHINEEILKTYALVTSSGATASGKKFMQATGYKFSRQLEQWYKTKGRK